MSSNPLTTILNAKEDLDTVYEKMCTAKTEWRNVGLGLMINPNTLGAIDKDSPLDCDKALRKMLKVWFDTKEPTWEKLCKCLRQDTVSRHALAAEIQDYVIEGVHKAPARPTRSISTEDEKMQVDNELDLEFIQKAFIDLQIDTKESLKQNQTKPQDIAVFFDGLPSKKVVKDRKELLEYHNDYESIDDIFHVMGKFMSFVDYHILERIITKYGEPKDKENLTEYTERLKYFLETWKVKPLEINESAEHQTKLNFKLDINSLKWYKDLQGAIAKFFKVKVYEVVLVEIKPGCVELIFALPTTAVERLLSLNLSEVADWTPTVLGVTVLDGPLKEQIIYEPVSVMLLKACRSKTPDIDQVRSYLEQKTCDVNMREGGEFKQSPLMWALENKHFEIAKLLLKYKPQVNIQDNEECSPLVLASRAGDLEIVQRIVALGAEIDLPTHNGWTPLMWAAQEGHAEVARFLLEKGAFVDLCDINGWTPLMKASQKGHVDVVNVLLDHNPKVNHLTSSTTWCALMAAAKNKHTEVVDTLLKRGAAVDIQKNNGFTTLQIASYYEDNSAVMDTLIKHGANVDHVNKDGLTALMLASSKGLMDAVQALRRGGADVNKERLGSGWTALFFAAKAGKSDVFRELLCRGAVTETSLDKVENVARTSGHEILLSDICKYKKASETKKVYARGQQSEQEARGKERVNPLTIILNAEEDLYTVYEKVLPAKSGWNNIGFGLKLNFDTLSAIDEECRGKSDKALHKMLKVWFDTKKPTWEKLCNCLRKVTVSRNVLADKIQDYVIKQAEGAGVQNALAKPITRSKGKKTSGAQLVNTEEATRSGLKHRSDPPTGSSKKAKVVKSGKIDDDLILLSIGDELKDKWVNVGVALGMKFKDLKHTIEDNPKIQNHLKPMEMFQMWQSTAGDSCTYATLASALERVGLVTCAQTYCYEQ